MHKPHLYTKSQLKDKHSIPSYPDISSRFSSEVNLTIQSNEIPSQYYFDSMETTQGQKFWKENNERDILNKNEKMELQVMYLRKVLKTIFRKPVKQ